MVIKIEFTPLLLSIQTAKYFPLKMVLKKIGVFANCNLEMCQGLQIIYLLVENMLSSTSTSTDEVGQNV